MQLGFVGTGTMGHPMARCLLEAGHALTVYDVRREATTDLCERGAGCIAKLVTPYLGYTNFIAALEGLLIGAKVGIDLRAPAVRYDMSYQEEDSRRG